MKDYIQKIISAFTSVKHSEEVTKEVHQWLVDEEHADEKEAVLNTLWQETKGQVDAGTWTSLANVYDTLGIGQPKTTQRFRMKVWHYAAASVILLVVSISSTYLFTKDRYSEVAMVESFTQAGDMSVIELPDGSKVQTNSATLLLYPETFKGATRTVYLVGEADFKVKKNPDQPFIVKSTTMSVTALGTEFNVAAYPENNEIVTTLLSGKVRVDCNGTAESHILHPGQQIVYDKKTRQSLIATANVEDVTAWQRGLIVFRGNTMKEIIAELERRFNVTFQCNVSHLSEDKYNFSFRKGSDIKEVLEVMKEVIGGLDYKIEKNVCFIKLTK